MENNHSFKAVILDFDGTIGDTRSLIVRTMRQTLAEVGLPQKSDDECAAMIGLPLKQTFTELMPMDDATGDLCEATYRRIFAENNKPGAVPMFPGVGATIRRMHAAGVKAVGVTYGNGRREDLEAERAEWIIDGFRELEGIVSF